MMMKKILLVVCLSITFLLSGCSDWIDVSSKQEIEADKLFKTEAGFKSARIGIYTRMTLMDTYGKAMTYGKIEELVQRYDNYGTNIPTDQERAKRYDYKNDTDAKEMVNNLWLHLYRTISNINELLVKLDGDGKNIVNADLWAQMKGEALGLRAFHYFDLLRLYGPVYSENPKMPCLPWRMEFNADRKVLLPANEIVEHILDDLKQAENLLMDEKELSGDLDQVGRRHYMNKWAVKALMARVYQWIGQKDEAAIQAQAVIDSCGLSLVRDNQADVAMFDEMIFGLGMDDMEEKVKADWVDKNTFANELYITSDNAISVFEARTVGISDIRYRKGWGFIHGSNGLLCRKYLGKDVLYKEKIPLIRLVEMYYILAESVELKDCVSLINEVRRARGISQNNDISMSNEFNEEARVNVLNKEYQKEFFAEGQWFYFLKRHNCQNFYRCPVEKMVYYVLPTPDDEVEYGI